VRQRDYYTKNVTGSRDMSLVKFLLRSVSQDCIVVVKAVDNMSACCQTCCCVDIRIVHNREFSKGNDNNKHISNNDSRL